MDRLISEQAVLDILPKYRLEESTIAEEVKAIPSADKWISISERLPETDEFRTEFIVTIRCDTWEENKTMVAEWENTTVRGKDVSRWIWYDRLIPHGWEVIAWMPLPKPYQLQERSGEE